MVTEVDVERAIASLDALARMMANAAAPTGLPWWGPVADAWRADAGRDAAALRAAADDLRRIGSRLREESVRRRPSPR